MYSYFRCLKKEPHDTNWLAAKLMMQILKELIFKVGVKSTKQKNLLS